MLTEDGAVVEKTYAGAAAERAGILAGDVIVAIDGNSLSGLTLEKVVALIRGEPGTQVELSIHRKDQTITKVVTREVVATNNVEYRAIAEGGRQIGYIKVSSLAPPDTSDDFQEALDSLIHKEKVDALIVDIRDNGGGLMGNLFLMAEPFLDQWDEIYAVKDLRFGYTSATNSRTFYENHLPLVVLVNGYSASASEVFAGTMQDHHRAYVLGTQTRGKGTGQENLENVYHFPNVIYYETTKIFLLPSGRTTQVYGITPDVTVAEVPEGFEARDNFIWREAHYDNAIQPIGPAPETESPSDALTVKACADKQGNATHRYAEAVAASQHYDYQLGYAVDFIGCALTTGLTRAPEED